METPNASADAVTTFASVLWADAPRARTRSTRNSPMSRWRAVFTALAYVCRGAGNNAITQGLSETRRRFDDHGKVFLEREVVACNAAFVEEPADQGHAVRHAPRGRELRQRPTWVGRPVAARLADLDEPGAQ